MSQQVGIDVGGTFTDLAVLDTETGELRTSKSPSTPARPVDGILSVLAGADVALPSLELIVHGTTVATNALLERTKALPGLITTQGFRDVLFIQRINRPHHYDLRWEKPRPFVERRNCLEVRERTDYAGNLLTPLDEASAREAVLELKRRGIRDIAVAFLFSYVNPANELAMQAIIEELHPAARVSLSHVVYPRWREYDRMSTVLADAFLKSLIADYLDNVVAGLRGASFDGELLLMKSNGGVEHHSSAAARPIDLVVSGPAAGVLATTALGRAIGRSRLISMDMGGTSFDVSLIEDGEARRTMEFEVEWGLPTYTPMIDVRTIGAGGGSVAWIDKGGLLRVGPRSAGATPGPACYGRGGSEATVTDANVVLGRIDPDYFLGGEMTLDAGAAHAAVARLAEQMSLEVEEAAAAIVELVDASMTNAIRLVSIDRGLDPREFSLVAFGGAGALHAGSLLALMGSPEVIVPVHQGVLSAAGLMTADMRVDESTTVSLRSDQLRVERLDEVLARLTAQACERLRDEGYTQAPLVRATVEMRYLGQNYGTEVALDAAAGALTAAGVAQLLGDFHATHRRLYGYELPEEVVELVHVNVTAIGPTGEPPPAPLPPRPSPTPKRRGRIYFRGHGWLEAPAYERDALPAGHALDGPALIEEPTATSLVHPGQRLAVDDVGNLIITMPGGQRA